MMWSKHGRSIASPEAFTAIHKELDLARGSLCNPVIFGTGTALPHQVAPQPERQAADRGEDEDGRNAVLF
jgi:hypothetical protein